MADIYPFRAIRFNDVKFATVSKVICPPYDVIQVPEYHKLLERHANNMVRVELPLQGKGDRYKVAADFWTKWQKSRALLQDKMPSYYGYEQRFSANGANFIRRGFFAALRLETPGKGKIRPHERTFPKHKEDRLHLMRATHANVSPIFGIFFDKQKKAAALLDRRMALKPLVTSRDDKGVTHKLWAWSDPEAVQVLTQVLRPEDVLIADGHHRYETAWNYAQERLGKNRSKSSAKGRQAFRYVMTFLCPLADPGLVIQPTHRAVRLPVGAGSDEKSWRQRIEPYFSMQKVSGLTALLTRLRSTEESSALALVLEGGPLFWLRPKTKDSSMPVVALNEGILKDIPLENISYGQHPKELVENLQRGEANAIFLLPPPDKEAFARICKAGRLLPQKSTYFYPKLATGLVMRSLDGEV
jgi:uncharacterized protein (DUF1015 family)